MIAPVAVTVRKPQAERLGLDQQPLFDLGLRQVRAYARALWTDHNTHDPGITTLELLCYALTDLCYRTCFPIEDLLATDLDNQRNMAEQVFGVREALPNSPLTELDYRRLLIDIEGVRNAWIYPVEATPCYVDSIHGELVLEDPGNAGDREVSLRGLYGALIECENESVEPADKATIVAAARTELQRHRNLCEDFIEVKPIERQSFLLCGEIEIEPSADPTEIYARILVAVQEHLAPGVPRHTRSDMLQRRKPDGSRWSDPDLFEGPAPKRGFIDATELAASERRSSIRLSDVIALIMDIEGVRAIRDIVIRAAARAADTDSESKWEVPVEKGKRSTLDAEQSRLILYMGSMPLPRGAAALTRYRELKDEAERGFATQRIEDPSIPLGRFRAAATYESVRKHFPAVYGIGEGALPSDAGLERQAQAQQLKGYLLLFDQLLANAHKQLGEVRQLFSRNPDIQHTYFSQKVDRLDVLYKSDPSTVELESTDGNLERRNRFLDHLIARFAERLPEDIEVQAALFGATREAVVRAKCAFLGDIPQLCSERGRAYDYTLDPTSVGAAGNVSGLEQRLTHLLGLGSVRLYVIENILLRPRPGAPDTFLPICAEPGCSEDCPGDDPYSYRLHVILPALAPRFRDMEFRRYAEGVIREETPAHLLPKICWVDDEDIQKVAAAWLAWQALLAGTDKTDPKGKLEALASALFDAKNVYPASTLADCAAADKFILGRSALGSEPPVPE